MLKTGLALLAVALASFTSNSASASLIGDEIGCSAISANPDVNLFTVAGGGTGDTAIVGSGVECALRTSSGDLTADFLETSPQVFLVVELSNFLNLELPLGQIDFVFSDLDWIGTPGRIIGISELNVSTWPNPATAISFTDNSVSFSLVSPTLPANARWFTAFEIETGPLAAPIPLPAGAVLLLSGLVGFGLLRRVRS